MAFPWRHRDRAQALGRAVAEVLDALPGADVDEAGQRRPPSASPTARAGDRRRPRSRPRVPVVAVTGTNGKTTTSRMVAHIARTGGLHVGWSSTDGIYIDGELVEAGDYSGPEGAGRVLAHQEVQLAVTETARGGILLKGIGADPQRRLGRHQRLRRPPRPARHRHARPARRGQGASSRRSPAPSGWAVLNGDDPRVFAMRHVIKAQPWVFSRDPDSPAIREMLDRRRPGHHRHRRLAVGAAPGSDPDPLVEVVDVPMTLAGLSRFNVENALAAASAALGARAPARGGRRGAAHVPARPEHNPGRMNFFSRATSRVVIDLAHNEAGLEALLEIMNGVRRPGARLLLGLGAVGDRQDDLVEQARRDRRSDADVVVIGTRRSTCGAAPPTSSTHLFRAGAARVGVDDVRRTRPRWTASPRWSSRPSPATSSA